MRDRDFGRAIEAFARFLVGLDERRRLFQESIDLGIFLDLRASQERQGGRGGSVDADLFRKECREDPEDAGFKDIRRDVLTNGDGIISAVKSPT